MSTTDPTLTKFLAGDAMDAGEQAAVRAKINAEESGAAWDGDIADINLDGGTDIGADLADADLILVDDGATGTNRKSALSRLWTYIKGKIESTALTLTVRMDATGQGTGTVGNTLMTRELSDARYPVTTVSTSSGEETRTSTSTASGANVAGLTGIAVEAATYYKLEIFGAVTASTTAAGAGIAMYASGGYLDRNVDSLTYQPGLFHYGNVSSPIALWFGTDMITQSRASSTTNKQFLYMCAWFKTNSSGTIDIRFYGHTAASVTLHAGAKAVLTKITS